MELEKNTIRALRGLLKKAIKSNEALYEKISMACSYAADLFVPIWDFEKDECRVDADNIICSNIAQGKVSVNEIMKTLLVELGEKTGYELVVDEGRTPTDIMYSLIYMEKLTRAENKKLPVLLKSITNEGIKTVSYNVPYLCLCGQDSDGTITRLIMMAIKKNAKDKPTSGELFDGTESQLYDYEKKLTLLIEDDYSVKIEKEKEFLELFVNYVDAYFHSIELTRSSEFDYEKTKVDIITMVALYIIKCETGLMADRDEYILFGNLVRKIGTFEGMDIVRAASLISEYIVSKQTNFVAVDEGDVTKVYDEEVLQVDEEKAEKEFREVLEHSGYEGEELEVVMARMDGLFTQRLVYGDLSVLTSLDALALSIVYHGVEEEPEKAVEESTERESIFDYMEGGRIARLCEAGKFEQLLSQSCLTTKEKLAYANEMKSLCEQVQEERHARKAAQYRSNTFSREEAELYDMFIGSMNGIAASEKAIANIDKLVDTLMGELDPYVDKLAEVYGEDVGDKELYEMAKNDENSREVVQDIDLIVEMVKEELASQFDTLRRLAGPRMENAQEETRVVYFTTNISDSTGEVISLPRILTSLLASDRTLYDQAYIGLRLLFDGMMREDKAMNRKLPYPVYIKGRDFKIFYTIVDGTVVVIDGMESNGDEYKRVGEVVKSAEFKEFISTLKRHIATGNRPNARNYTSLILNELESGKSFKKKMY